MRKILKHFIKNYFDKKLPIIEGSAKLKENKGESILVIDETRIDFLSNLESILEIGYFVKKIFLFFEGEILVELTTEDVERVYIEDTYLKNSLSFTHTIPEITRVVNNSAIDITPNKSDEELDKEMLVEEMSLLENDIENEDISVESDLPNNNSISTTKKIVLVIDRSPYQEDLLERLATFYKDDTYRDSQVVNFYAMINPKTKTPFILEAIKELRSTAISTKTEKEIEESYNKFRKICIEWYEEVKKLDVRDVVCKRVYNSDRFVTPEIVLWLWGYYVMGKKAKWIMANNGSTLRIYKNEFMVADIKSNEMFINEGNKICSAPGELIINSLDKYMILGYLNYLYDNGLKLPEMPKWRSDNVSFESHIAGAFGQYTRVPHRVSIVENINKINGKNAGSDTRLALYETFIERYYKAY